MSGRQPHDGAPLKSKMVWACSGGHECYGYSFEALYTPTHCDNCGGTNIHFVRWKEDPVNPYVHISTEGGIVIDDPDPAWTDDEVLTFIDEVRRDLDAVFETVPSGKMREVNLASMHRGGHFSLAIDALTTLLTEQYDRVKEYKTRFRQ